MLTVMPNIATASNFQGTFLRKIYDRNRIQWHALISEYPVTQPMASNRDTMVYVNPLIQLHYCIIRVMLTIGVNRFY